MTKLGDKFTEEHKKNLSLAHKGQHPVTEWKKGTSGFAGRIRSEESRRKQSETRKQRIKDGLIVNPKGMLGRHHSDLSKQRISEKNKSRPLTQEEKESLK